MKILLGTYRAIRMHRILCRELYKQEGRGSENLRMLQKVSSITNGVLERRVFRKRYAWGGLKVGRGEIGCGKRRGK